MEGYVVIVRFEIFKEKFDDFIIMIEENAKKSIEENGCLQFDISVDKHNVFLYEIYKSKEAFDLHLNAYHYKEFQDKTTEYIKNKIVETYDLYSYNI